MVCPYCEHCDTRVVDKRESDAYSTRRRRECLECRQRFTTYERVDPVEMVVVKQGGRKETFSPDKLRRGLALALAKRPVTAEQVEQTVVEIEAELRAAKMREIPAEMIGKLVLEKLKRLDHVAYIRFTSVYRDFTDVRSFEDEVKELLH